MIDEDPTFVHINQLIKYMGLKSSTGIRKRRDVKNAKLLPTSLWSVNIKISN